MRADEMVGGGEEGAEMRGEGGGGFKREKR
jgi:hypothetical protein